MAKKHETISQAQPKGESESVDNHKPIPFDDALRVLVNTPPKPKKSELEGQNKVVHKD